MLKVKVLVCLPVLLALLSSIACSSPLSLEDYAEECGDWRNDYGNIGSASVSDIEDALEDWDDLSPPDEVKGIHDMTADALRLTLDIAREGEDLEDKLDDLRDELDDAPSSQRDDIRDEMDDLQDEYEDRIDDLQDELEELGEEYEDELDELPRRVVRDLESGGCS